MSMTPQEKAQKSIFHWAFHPLDWVRDIFPTVTLDPLQTHALEELGKMYRAKYKRSQNEQLTDEETEYARKIGVSIMSGHRCGKDFIAAIVSCHFLMCFPFARGMATANTGSQLKNVFWSTIATILRLSKKLDPNDPRSKSYLDEYLELQSEKMFLKAYKGRESFMEFVTWPKQASDEAQAETLAGRNADYKIVVIDEASGIPYPVFRPFEGSQGGIISIAFMIFNPTRSKGYAVDSQYKDRERWLALRWNSEESHQTNKDDIKELEKKYGRESNTYRMRVLGLPPLSDSDVLIPSDWIEDAKERIFEPDPLDVILSGVDAGGGGDNSVHSSRRGGTILPFKRSNNPNTKETGQWAANLSLQGGSTKTFIEMDGLGRGVYFEARSIMGGRAVPVTMGGKAREDDKYANKRAECAMNFRQAFEDGTVSLYAVKDDQDFIDQLNAIKKTTDSSGRILIVKKAEIKVEIGHSPDEFDATALTYSVKNADILYRKHEDEKTDKYDEEEERRDTSWMSA